MPLASVSVSSTKPAADDAEQQRSIVSSGGSFCRSCGSVAAVQPPLEQRHQQHVQRRDREQAVGEQRDQQMQLERGELACWAARAPPAAARAAATATAASGSTSACRPSSR